MRRCGNPLAPVRTERTHAERDTDEPIDATGPDLPARNRRGAGPARRLPERSRPAEAKVEGGTAKVEQSSVSVKPSEERQNTLRVVIKGIPPGRVVPVVD